MFGYHDNLINVTDKLNLNTCDQLMQFFFFFLSWSCILFISVYWDQRCGIHSVWLRQDKVPYICFDVTILLCLHTFFLFLETEIQKSL